MRKRVGSGTDSPPKPSSGHRDHPLLPGLPIRRVRPLKPKELVLHMVVAKLLREHCLPSWQWTHFPSGEIRDIRTAAKLKQMGVQKGWPDFLLISPVGIVHCLELKRAGLPLTEGQSAFRTWCGAHQVQYVRAATLDEVLNTFDYWPCLNIVLRKTEETDAIQPIPEEPNPGKPFPKRGPYSRKTKIG